MTFYEALNEFEDRYLAALAVESKRVIDIFDQEWQTICNEFTCYTVATSEGKTTEAADHIQNILDILTDNGIIVTEPVALPLPPGVTTSPSTVPIVCDSDGTPVSGAYTNAFSVIQIYLGSFDDTTNWSYAITDQTNATATNLTVANQIDITSITADSGTIEVTCSKATYEDFVVTISVYKVREGVAAYVINANPDSITIPVIGTPVYTGAVSYFSAIVGNVDDTGNWTFAIDAVSNVTANILSGNELWITNISASQGYVDVEASKSGYDSVIIRVPVYQTTDLSNYYTKAETDAGFVAVTGAQSAAGAKTWSDQGTFSAGALMATGAGNGIYWGDGDLGFEELTDDELTMQGTYVQGSALASFRLVNETSSYTNPVYASKYDSTSGLGFGAAQSISLIAFGTEVMRSSHLTTDFNLPFNVNDDVTADNLVSEGSVSLAGDIDQTGTATDFQINPYQVLSLGRDTNNGSFRVGIYAGDGTATINHNLLGSGDSYLCAQGDYLGVGHTSTPRGQIDVIDSGGVGHAYMPGDGGWVVKRNLSSTAVAFRVRNSADNDLIYSQCDRKLGINYNTPGDHACYIYSEETAGTKPYAPLAVDMSASGSSNQYLVSFMKNDGDDAGGITNGIGGTLLQNPSAAALKDEIKDSEVDAIALLNSIKVRDFHFKSDKSKTKITGYVADENIGVIEGFALEDGESKTVATAALIPYLHKAILELEQRVVALEGS